MRPTAWWWPAALLGAELAVLAVSGIASAFAAAPAAAPAAQAGSRLPVWGGFVSAMVLGIWMVDGWEVSASTSEETRDGGAGAGGVVGLLIAAAFLLGCTVAYLHLGGPAAIAGHEVDVLAFVGGRLGGAWKTTLIATVLVSLAAALETTLLYLVRSMYAMGRDGVLPLRLGALGAKTKDPDAALVVVTVASLAATILAGFVPTANDALDIALGGSSVFLGLLFLVSCAAALRLRDKETPLFRRNRRPVIDWNSGNRRRPSAACDPLVHCGGPCARGSSRVRSRASKSRREGGGPGGCEHTGLIRRNR